MKFNLLVFLCVCLVAFVGFVAAEKKNSALVIINIQKCFIDGAVAVTGAKDIIPIINDIRKNNNFDKVYVVKDWHPTNHVSFASTHKGKQTTSAKLIYTVDMKLCKDSETGTDLEYTIECKPEDKAYELEQALWPDHCIKDTPDSELSSDLTIDATKDVIITKGTEPQIDSFSAFFDNARGIINNNKYGKTGLDAKFVTDKIQHVFVVGLPFDMSVQFTAMDAKALPGVEEVYVIKEATKSKNPDKDATVTTNLHQSAVRVIDQTKVAGILALLSKEIEYTPKEFRDVLEPPEKIEDTTPDDVTKSMVVGLKVTMDKGDLITEKETETIDKGTTDKGKKDKDKETSVEPAKKHSKKTKVTPEETTKPKTDSENPQTDLLENNSNTADPRRFSGRRNAKLRSKTRQHSL